LNLSLPISVPSRVCHAVGQVYPILTQCAKASDFFNTLRRKHLTTDIAMLYYVNKSRNCHSGSP
jgi:hypothetical protein